MSSQQNNVNLFEKSVSILSYITMGIIGLVWIIVATLKKQKIRFFLMYNIAQSMIISIFLSIIKLASDLLIQMFVNIPILNIIAEILNFLFVKKIIFIIGFSFSLIEMIIFLLFAYLILGICYGRIFTIPVLTNLMKKMLANY